MVDVGDKRITKRSATAVGIVRLPDEIYCKIIDGEIKSPKGPVFQTAVIGGTLAAKRTSEMIPLCHPLPIEKCRIDIEPIDSNCVRITCTVQTESKTGVEMEALQGVSGAALTLYDMCKALSQNIIIGEIKLLKKSGGNSDYNAQQ